MSERITTKIEEIKQYANELTSILPKNFDEYANNFEKRAACERYFEKIVEAIVDLAFLFIKRKRLRNPEDDRQAFDVLAEANVISKSLAQKMKSAKGMRNVIAHEYGGVNNEMVFHTLTQELEKDVREFIEKIKDAP